jgi:hypothetical protein
MLATGSLAAKAIMVGTPATAGRTTCAGIGTLHRRWRDGTSILLWDNRAP